MKGYPKWFLRALIATMLVMWVTGGLLTPTTLVLRAEVDMARLPGSARVLTVASHAAGGLVMTLLIGALFSVHMRSGWRRRRQRGSGLLVATLFMVLNASAVGIYYLGDDTLGAAAAFIHLGVGLVLIGPLAWHWVRGRRARRQAQSLAHTHRAAMHHKRGKGPQLPASSHKPTHKAAPTP